MATIMDLFDKNKKRIYGENGYIFIESQGLVNVPRAKALALESPGGVGAAITSTVSKLIGGGSIGRPTDTIFKGAGFFNKPISLTAPTDALLADAVKPGTEYFVKTTPSPALLGTKANLKSLFSNKNAAQSAAISALNKYGSKTGIQKFKDSLKKPSLADVEYGQKFAHDSHGNVNKDDYLYSTHYKTPGSDGLTQREKSLPAAYTGPDSYKSQWDWQTEKLLGITEYSEETAAEGKEKIGTIKNFVDKIQPELNVPYVLFKVYGDTEKSNRSVLLPATVTNLSEQFTPAINTFKYVGSPFNLYRYSGIERVLSFDLKLYYTDETTKTSMIKKLNLLREYTFPDRNLSTISYKDNTYSPITFNPNILQLTISGLYKDLYCIIETMTFTIEDNIPWATENNLDGAAKDESKPYPTTINVTLSLKIIEHTSVKNEKGVNTFEYEKSEAGKYTNYFTGYNEKLIANGK